MEAIDQSSRLLILESLSVIHGLIHEGNQNSYCLAVSRLESVILTVSSITGTQNSIFTNILESALEFVLNEISYLTPSKPVIGRPKIQLSKPQLEYLLSLRFTATKIAQYYKISRFTVMRRLSEYNLSVTGTYTEISDEELGSIVSSILLQFPNSGYKRMKGYLQARSIKVTDYRIRSIMQIVDPEGVYMRTIWKNRLIRRRAYFVQYSNQLWHIDGNLKLIRWGIIIRCGIDGKSRTATYISATNNNRSDTHLNDFVSGVSRYGVPLRSRSDKGGENVLIAKFMIEQRGTGRGSHVVGRSVHNQRIERFWRDVFEGCTSTYYHLFWKLEDDGMLDIDNPMHMWTLHFVFLPRLNYHLNMFIEGWNNHPLSTEHNLSPNQLMLLNLPPPNLDILLTQEELNEAEFRCDELSDLGRFDEIANPDAELTPSATAQSLNSTLLVDVMRDSEHFGYDIYIEALQKMYGAIIQ